MAPVPEPGASDSKESACNAGDPGSVPESGRAPGRGLGNPLQYSCLENPMGRGAWWATVHRVSKIQTRLKGLSVHACTKVKNLSNKENLAPEFCIRTLLILDATCFSTTLQRNGWVHKQMSPLVLQGITHPNLHCGTESVHGIIPSSDR